MAMKNLILTLLLSLISLSSYAFRVTPMTAEFDAKGRGATQTFQVDNNGDKEVALEIDALTRKVDIDGKEKREKTKDFMIYPLQLTVKPGEKKNIRVSYVGNEPEKEAPYRLVVRQLPVNLEKKKPGETAQSQINFLFEYVASLYVKGKTSATAKIELQDLKKEGNSLSITLKNSGGAHILFKNYNVVLSDGKEKLELNMSDAAYDTLGGINLLAGDVRRILLPIPQKLKGDKFSVDFKLR